VCTIEKVAQFVMHYSVNPLEDKDVPTLLSFHSERQKISLAKRWVCSTIKLASCSNGNMHVFPVPKKKLHVFRLTLASKKAEA
jgi:hypothetical protein